MEDWIQVSRLPILWLVPSHSRKSCWERSLAPVEDDRISKSRIQPSTALERRGKTVWSTLIINNWYKTSINYFWQIVRCITSNFRKFSSFDPSNLPHNSMIIIRILFENVTIDTIRPSLKTIRFFPCFFFRWFGSSSKPFSTKCVMPRQSLRIQSKGPAASPEDRFSHGMPWGEPKGWAGWRLSSPLNV